MTQEQLELLKHVTYSLIFDKHIHPERYTLDFPTGEMKGFPEFEDLLYQFGEQSLQADMTPYIRPLLKGEFLGSSIALPLFWTMRFDK